MDIRKNIYELTDIELQNFKTALQRLKLSGEYDGYVRRHWQAASDFSLITPDRIASFRDVLAQVLPDSASVSMFASQLRNFMAGQVGQQATTYFFERVYAFPVLTQRRIRNTAHRGPSFLPWHRVFIRELELDLQKAVPEANPPVTLPYWDWAADSAAGPQAKLWNTDPAQGRVYLGGDGDQSTANGPLRDWKDIIAVQSSFGEFTTGGSLTRQLGGMGRIPDVSEVRTILNLNDYDSPPWGDNAAGFRDRIEQLHDPVHMWVGGSMMPMTSPNDPIFFLHHCNIDRIWASRQEFKPELEYRPQANGPWGHNFQDAMRHLNEKDWIPEKVINYRTNLGYEYDQLVTF